MKIAIVVSEFNSHITTRLLQGAQSRLIELGVDERSVTVVKVPGAVEIPLAAKLLAQSKKYKAIICLGAVIQGETDHYDYVCQQVSQGCLQIMLQFSIPVIFEVLTTKNEKQAKDRAGGKEGNKGIDGVDAAMHMIELMSSLTKDTVSI